MSGLTTAAATYAEYSWPGRVLGVFGIIAVLPHIAALMVPAMYRDAHANGRMTEEQLADALVGMARLSRISRPLAVAGIAAIAIGATLAGLGALN